MDPRRALEELAQRRRNRRLFNDYAKPFDHSKPFGPDNVGVYQWQIEFHNAGAKFAERCLTIATKTNSQKYIAKAWLLQGEIAIARQAWAEAGQLLGKALKLATVIGNPPLTVAAHMALGGLHGETKRGDKAVRDYLAARAIVERIKADTKDPDLRNGLDNAPAFRQIDQLLPRP